MKGRTLSILGIFAAAVGAILIICKDSISLMGVTITGGILFMAVGLVNLIFYSAISKNENATGRVLTLISNSAAIVLGLSMLIFKSTFAPMISFIFGLLVAICALWQFFVLAVGARPYQLPAWLYVFPVLLAGGAVYIYLRSPKVGDEDAILMLATGISFAVLGIAALIEGSALGIARRNFEHAKKTAAASATPAQPTDTTDTGTDTEVVTTGADIDEKEPKRISETTDDLDDEVQ